MLILCTTITKVQAFLYSLLRENAVVVVLLAGEGDFEWTKLLEDTRRHTSSADPEKRGCFLPSVVLLAIFGLVQLSRKPTNEHATGIVPI